MEGEKIFVPGLEGVDEAALLEEGENCFSAWEVRKKEPEPSTGYGPSLPPPATRVPAVPWDLVCVFDDLREMVVHGFVPP